MASLAARSIPKQCGASRMHPSTGSDEGRSPRVPGRQDREHVMVITDMRVSLVEGPEGTSAMGKILLARGEHEVARRIAAAAGDVLLALRQNWSHPADVRGLRDCGDRTSHALIMRLLRDSFPGDAVLSEEGKDDPERLAHRRVWIVDPLDGTREFSEGRDDWAVHVALAIDGRPVAGAVALPAQDLVFATESPPPRPCRQERPLRMVVSRT